MENHCVHIFQKKASGYNNTLKEIYISHFFKISATILLSIMGMMFTLVTPLIMRSLIDDVLINRNIHLLIPLIVSFLLVYLLSSLSNYFSNYIKGNLDLIIFKDLSNYLFKLILNTKLIEIQKYKIGDLLSRTIENVSSIVDAVITLIPEIVIAVIAIILPFVIMVSLNSSLAYVVISPIILFIVFSKYFGNKVKICQKPALDASADMQSFFKEAYSIIPLTKTYNLQNWIDNRYESVFSGYYNKTIEVVKVTSLYSSIAMLIYEIPSLLVLIIGSYSVISGTMTIGTLTAFFAYVGQFFSPIQHLSLLWTNYKGTEASYARVQEIANLNKDQWGNKNLAPIIKTITLEGIWFAYGSRPILSDFHATFYQGHNYLIGKNGSGKSTIIQLLCGLYNPDKGRILLDNEEISNINMDSLRSSVSVVFSEALVFDGSIYENILVGDLSASYNDVILAANKAELDKFVRKLKNGYETNVGEDGLNLSSGEKQKIALARVILRNSPIIIFDEFTRSIDYEAKKSINAVINELRDKIVIIITHDSSEIIELGNIVFLNDRG